MRATLLLAAVALVAVMVSCASTRPWTPERRVVAAKCAACHPVPLARSLPPAKLGRVLDAHARRVELSTEHRRQVELHLLAVDSGAPTN